MILGFLWYGLLMGGEANTAGAASSAALAKSRDKSFLGLLAKGDAVGFGGGVEVLGGLACSGRVSLALAPRQLALAPALGLFLAELEFGGGFASLRVASTALFEEVEGIEPASPSI